MRLKTPRTLLAIAIAIGLAAALGTGAAFCGQGGPHGDPDTRLERLTRRLDLTPQQQAQVKTILEEERTAADQLHAQVRQRIQGVLTEEQRAAEAAQQQRGLDRQVDRLTGRLRLSPEQVTQVRAILAERLTNPALARTELQGRIAAVLTPEQQQRFAAMESRGEHRGKRGDGPRGDGPPTGGSADGPQDGRRGGPGDGPGDGPADGPEYDNGRDGR